jgi:hypothetical protein
MDPCGQHIANAEDVLVADGRVGIGDIDQQGVAGKRNRLAVGVEARDQRCERGVVLLPYIHCADAHFGDSS